MDRRLCVATLRWFCLWTERATHSLDPKATLALQITSRNCRETTTVSPAADATNTVAVSRSAIELSGGTDSPCEGERGCSEHCENPRHVVWPERARSQFTRETPIESVPCCSGTRAAGLRDGPMQAGGAPRLAGIARVIPGGCCTDTGLWSWLLCCATIARTPADDFVKTANGFRSQMLGTRVGFGHCGTP